MVYTSVLSQQTFLVINSTLVFKPNKTNVCIQKHKHYRVCIVLKRSCNKHVWLLSLRNGLEAHQCPVVRVIYDAIYLQTKYISIANDAIARTSRVSAI